MTISNNKMMRVDLKTKNQFFKIIRNIRKCKGTLYPSVFDIAAGTYSGTNILKGFTGYGQRSWYDFLTNGRFSVGSSDDHKGTSHRCNLIYSVCSCTHRQGQSIGKCQLTLNSTIFVPISISEPLTLIIQGGGPNGPQQI